MITRYSRPEMRAIWTDENKLKTWLQIELLASEALVAEELFRGVILPKLKPAVINGSMICPDWSHASANWKRLSTTMSSASPPPSPRKSTTRPAAGSISA